MNKGLQNVDAEVINIKLNIHRDNITDWLSPPDPSKNFNEARKQRHEGTGLWLLGSDIYSAWKTKPNSFLWLNGIPGCGKTILSSTVIVDLECTDPLINLLYFYFDFNDMNKQCFEKAIRSFINQLYYKRKECRAEVDSLYDDCKKGNQQPDDTTLLALLQNLIQKVGEIWIVLDALDEHEEKHRAEGFLPWIKTLQDCASNTHILVTSRPEVDIELAFKTWALDEDIIPLKNDSVNQDIRGYVTAMVAKMQRWQSLPDIQKEIQDALIGKANGMYDLDILFTCFITDRYRFRWVFCQLDMLKDCLSPKEIRDALKSLPQNLDETYVRILERMRPQYKRYTTRLLQFLTYSDRPLRIEEAVDAVAVNTAEVPRFDEKNRMPIPREIARYCSSLVVLVDRNIQDDTETVTEIQLAHFSVKEYLMSDRLYPDIASSLGKIPAMTAMTEVFLSYLLDLDDSRSLQDIKKSYPMAQFSAQYWMDYATVA